MYDFIARTSPNGSQFSNDRVSELTNSPLQLGLVGLARAVPQMGILLFGGLLADAMNRRRLMIRTQASLFCVSGTLALITLAGRTMSLTLTGQPCCWLFSTP